MTYISEMLKEAHRTRKFEKMLSDAADEIEYLYGRAGAFEKASIRMFRGEDAHEIYNDLMRHMRKIENRYPEVSRKFNAGVAQLDRASDL